MTCFDDLTIARLLGGGGDLPDGFDQHLDVCESCRAVVGEALLRVSLPRDLLGVSLLEPGARVGRYVLLGRLGQGAHGVVHRAHDPELDRRIAVKLVVRSSDPERNARLLAEARAMARLDDPHVVRVYDAGTEDESVFVAMELVTGGTLRTWHAERRPWTAVLDRYLEAARGLAAAHRIALVHRDFKPDNVLVGEDGRARVADFGLVGHATDAESDAESTSGVGTPRYMSPEAHAGETIDARSDQYSFCAALFEGLYGQPAFAGDDAKAIAKAKADGEIVEAPRVGPRALLRVLRRGLQPDPASRHRSMEELIVALERVRTRSRRIASAAGLLLAVGVGAAATVLASTPRDVDCPDATPELEGIWDADVQTEIAARGRTIDRAAAVEVVERASMRIDDYAREWIDSRTRNCHARASEGVPEAIADARDNCLEVRRAGLEALTTELRSLDPDMLARVSSAAWDLPPVGDCEDPKPIASDRLHALEQLERARALTRLMRLNAAEPMIRSVLDVATATGDDWLAAEAGFDVALLLSRRDADEEARDACEAAALAAVRSDNDRIAAAAWVQLYWMGRGEHEDRKLPEHYERLAQAAVDAVDDPGLRASLAHARGESIKTTSPPRALEHYEDAVRHEIEAAGREDHPSVAERMLMVALVRASAHERTTALSVIRRAREILVAAHGEDDQAIARAWEYESLALEGDPEAQLEAHERAAAIMERLLGRDAEQTLMTRANALTRRSELRPQERAQILTQLDAVIEKLRTKGVDAQRGLAPIYIYRARILQELGHLDEALEACRHAADVVRAALGEGSYMLALAHDQCGDTLIRMREREQALVEYRASLRVIDATLGVDSAQHGSMAQFVAELERELESGILPSPRERTGG